MRVKPRSLKVDVPGGGYRMRIVGHRATPLRDAYHGLLRMAWHRVVGLLALAYLALNGLFALGYLAVGGIANARPGSFRDAFFFSVDTLGTIGYGAMYPASPAAHALVALESFLGIVLVALVTGLVFAKFSLVRARFEFSRHAVITPFDGRPTLMVRFGNARGNDIIDAQVRVALVRTERTAEGRPFYRTHDLALVRHRMLTLSRSWTALHVLDAASPLHGETPESLVARDTELHVLVVGTDDTTLQGVHAFHRYFPPDILWGARHTDILSEDARGDFVIDIRRFHDTEPSEPTADFPYPR